MDQQEDRQEQKEEQRRPPTTGSDAETDNDPDIRFRNHQLDG